MKRCLAFGSYNHFRVLCLITVVQSGESKDEKYFGELSDPILHGNSIHVVSAHILSVSWCVGDSEERKAAV